MYNKITFHHVFCPLTLRALNSTFLQGDELAHENSGQQENVTQPVIIITDHRSVLPLPMSRSLNHIYLILETQ